MLFHSISFLIFFTVVVIGLLLIKKISFQKYFLLFMSYVFYMYWNPIFIFLLLFSTVVDFLSGLKISETNNRTSKKKWLILSLTLNISVLVFFKYYNLFNDGLYYFLSDFNIQPSWITKKIILPLGISFFTFQSMSYTIDVYKEKLMATKSLLDFSLFIAFFPQMIAGPIVRAAHFLPQLIHKRYVQFTHPILLLFARGLFKKLIIADNIAFFTEGVFENPSIYSGFIFSLTSILCYIQVYCDFSGYSDMAIALGKSMGFDFPKNFNSPIKSRSFTDFWQRWHITLSIWFRDYVYVALGGNKKRVYLNLFIVMFISGVWHGAGFNFLIWGVLHGVLIVVERFFKWNKSKSIFVWFYTQFLFSILLLLFWVNDYKDILIILEKFKSFDFSMFGLGYLNPTMVLFVSLIFLVFQLFKTKFDVFLIKLNGLNLAFFWITLGMVFYLLAPPFEKSFIYFQF